MIDEQTHPLYPTDRSRLDELLDCKIPESSDLIDLARLSIRYEGFPGVSDLKKDIVTILRIWNMDLEEVNTQTRKIWKSYTVLPKPKEDTIGSGFDAADNGSDD
uniref:DUF3288 family protein n=1 Tax=Paulinella chromatophora TaxID=39717 RepID=B1X408_PAUCH|nr:hypothetical protein PCC_0228 [Paulinella chromatophora]ACB42677.1 hypothetical protein PCC_0228 [Paulinella chromatophora]